jgi:hypothetical protein
MKKESSFRKFVAWTGGIVAPVLTAVLIYHFTNPKPAPPPPPAPTPVTFEGMVVDGAANAPLKGAMVSFEISDTEGGPFLDFTDEHGSYRADFNGLKTSARATVRVKANGFEAAPPHLLHTIESDNRADFILHPLPPAAGATPTPTPPSVLHPPVYVRKVPMQVIDIRTLHH